METREEDENVVVSVRGGASIVQAKPEFSIDFKYVMCSSGYTIKVFSIKSGECVHTLRGHRDIVTSIKLNPNNQFQILSSSLDKTVIKWDYRDGLLIKEYNLGHPVHELFTPETEDGKLYAVLKLSKNVHTLVHFKLPTQQNKVSHEALHNVSGKEGHTDLSNKSGCAAHISGTELHVVKLKTKKMKIHTYKDHVKAKDLQLTCVQCHPTEQCVATGVSNGKIVLWYNIFSENKNVVTSINHWHSLPVLSLQFTSEGSYLLSGGHECVLVKWQWNSHHKDFLPRLGSPIISISCSRDNSYYALCHFENGIQVITSNFKVAQSFQGLSLDHVGHSVANHVSTGLCLEPKTKALVTKGRPGHLQFYDLDRDKQLSILDVVRHNYISPDTLDKPLPVTDVEQVAFDPAGDWLATVERLNNDNMPPEISLKFWAYVTNTKGYKLNTLVNLPHNKEVTALKFRPRQADESLPNPENLMAVSASKDNYFKLWQLVDDTDIYRTNQSWSCVSVGFYRDQEPTAVDFSEDGTLLAVGFESTLTLWDPDSTSMQTSFSLNKNTDDKIRHTVFGRDNSSHFLMVGTDSMLYVWNLLSCSVTWCLPVKRGILVGSPVSEHFAVFSSKSLNVYKPQSSKPVYQRRNLDSSEIMTGLFVPHQQTAERMSAGVLSWQQNAQLYFMTKNQKLLTINYAMDEDSHQKLAIVSQDLPQTPFSILFSKRKNMGIREQRTEEVLSKQLKGTFLSEMLNTPAHVMPPTSSLAMSFMDSLIMKSNLRNSADEEDNEDDAPDEDNKEDPTSSDSDMEVEEATTKLRNMAPLDNQKELHQLAKEYEKLKPNKFKWL